MTAQQLPEGWQMVKFGEIANHISKRVEPSETQLDIYVGLEHLDPDSLKIKRHGVPSDVAGQKLLVKKGQIIFGKRRAYQRKVAVADWDCICSAHAMVLETNLEKVIPGFLPFFMQSDVFMSRAVAISEGSLSPTIKWKALSDQKFLIPNLDAQEKFVKLMKHHQVLIERYENLKLSCETLTGSIMKNELLVFDPFGGIDEPPKGWEIKTLDDIAIVERGKFSPRPRGNPIYYDGAYPFIQTGDIGKANIFITNHEQTLNDKGLAVSEIFPKDTIFLTIAANIGDVAISTYPVAATDSVVAIRPKNCVSTGWLLFYLKSLKIYLDRTATESAQKNINLGLLRPLKIAVPPREHQEATSKLLFDIAAHKSCALQSAVRAKDLAKGFFTGDIDV